MSRARLGWSACERATTSRRWCMGVAARQRWILRHLRRSQAVTTPTWMKRHDCQCAGRVTVCSSLRHRWCGTTSPTRRPQNFCLAATLVCRSARSPRLLSCGPHAAQAWEPRLHGFRDHQPQRAPQLCAGQQSPQLARVAAQRVPCRKSRTPALVERVPVVQQVARRWKTHRKTCSRCWSYRRRLDSAS